MWRGRASCERMRAFLVQASSFTEWRLRLQLRRSRSLSGHNQKCPASRRRWRDRIGRRPAPVRSRPQGTRSPPTSAALSKFPATLRNQITSAFPGPFYTYPENLVTAAPNRVRSPQPVPLWPRNPPSPKLWRSGRALPRGFWEILNPIGPIPAPLTPSKQAKIGMPRLHSGLP
jgi:hypothetical protein